MEMKHEQFILFCNLSTCSGYPELPYSPCCLLPFDHLCLWNQPEVVLGVFKGYGKILASHVCEILVNLIAWEFYHPLNPQRSESKTVLLSAAVVRDVHAQKQRSGKHMTSTTDRKSHIVCIK